MQAIILAGGLGTRLKSVVVDKPKALSPVAGNPFLFYVINYLQKHGVNHFIFSLGYLSNQILDYLQKDFPKLKFTFYIEDIPLGTGGGIKKAIELSTENDVLIVNADTYFDVSLGVMLDFHHSSKSNCTISLKEMTNFDRYGAVEVDKSNTILSFKEKSFTKQGLINGGYLILDKKYFLENTKTLPEIFSFEKDFLEVNLHKMMVKGFKSNGYFIDIGIPEDFAKAQNSFINFSSNN